MHKTKVAVVGLGFIGARHIDALSRVFGAEIVAVSDVKAATVEKYAGMIGANGYTDYLEMLAREEIDALHDCTPNSMHYAVTKAAIEKGVSVYGEKPLTASIQEGEQLARLAREKGVRCAVNFNYRGNAAVWEMRERLSSAGRCFVIHGKYLQDGRSRDTDYGWREAQAGEGPRALADIGSHLFDLAAFVYGQRIVSVCADPFIAYQTRAGREIKSDDGAVILARFENGVSAGFIVSQVSAGYKNDLALSFDCENYSLRWRQQDADKLIIGRRDGGEETIFAGRIFTGAANRLATLPNGHPVGWADALKNSVQAFYDAIHGVSEGDMLCGFDDALRVMKITDACVRSGKSGAWVDVG